MQMNRPEIRWVDMADSYQCVLDDAEIWSDDKARIERILDALDEQRIKREETWSICGALLLAAFLCVVGALAAAAWWGW
jgi:hypothetical protein